MSKELSLVERAEVVDKVAQEFYKATPVATIAKKFNLRRVDVLGYIDEIKRYNRDSVELRERATDALHEADKSISLVVERAWETVEQADEEGDLKNKIAALKLASDNEVRRVEMLQKAGLYDDASMGDELAAQEERQAILIGILKEVSLQCDHCKVEVARRLKKVTGQAQTVDNNIYEGEVAEP